MRLKTLEQLYECFIINIHLEVLKNYFINFFFLLPLGVANETTDQHMRLVQCVNERTEVLAAENEKLVEIIDSLKVRIGKQTMNIMLHFR